jgi:hypothetical protein
MKLSPWTIWAPEDPGDDEHLALQIRQMDLLAAALREFEIFFETTED